MATALRIEGPKTTKHLDQLRALVHGEAEPPPVAKLVGFDFVSIDLGRSVFELQAGRKHANPMGTLHGGIICDLADAAMGTAMASTLEDDESFTSLDLTVKFLKPVWNARLRATAQLVKRTRSLGLLECEVTDDKGSLVARVYSTCMVLRGEDAEGR
ncbi:MAG TPA: PaaI family thioesterase [Polyangiaceae bacterium]|nr:PaaI family thioesterase [Polyangiaceae bacterium]